MTNYRRNLITGGTYFFTVNIADRQLRLLTDHLVLLRQSIQYTMQRHPFRIDAMVILPDHLHAIWTLPEADSDYALRWRLVKTYFSRHLPRIERVSESRSGKSERGIWQRRYWEHTIRDEEDFARHVDYIHINPVKHGYVTKAVDWPHSSIHRFISEGILPVDWAGV